MLQYIYSSTLINSMELDGSYIMLDGYSFAVSFIFSLKLFIFRRGSLRGWLQPGAPRSVLLPGLPHSGGEAAQWPGRWPGLHWGASCRATGQDIQTQVQPDRIPGELEETSWKNTKIFHSSRLQQKLKFFMEKLWWTKTINGLDLKICPIEMMCFPSYWSGMCECDDPFRCQFSTRLKVRALLGILSQF